MLKVKLIGAIASNWRII